MISALNRGDTGEVDSAMITETSEVNISSYLVDWYLCCTSYLTTGSGDAPFNPLPITTICEEYAFGTLVIDPPLTIERRRVLSAIFFQHQLSIGRSRV
jgi:hypothetical protein